VTIDTVIEIVSKCLLVTIYVAGPTILTAMGVGLIMSVLQASTQIQETSLSFVPKMLAVGAALVVTGRWSLNHLIGFFHELLNYFSMVQR
jgi:flagellar biosynthesis protein FliQ